MQTVCTNPKREIHFQGDVPNSKVLAKKKVCICKSQVKLEMTFFSLIAISHDFEPLNFKIQFCIAF